MTNDKHLSEDMRAPVAAHGGCSTAVLGAVGDIALCGPTEDRVLRHGDGWVFERVKPILARADMLFGNLESVILPSGYPPEMREPRGLVAVRDMTGALSDAGFGFVNLANNHILDAGTSGLRATRDALAARGLCDGGAGDDREEAEALRLIERSGLRWGFLCFAEDSNYSLSTAGAGHAYYDPPVILERIAEARDQVDVLVVSVHADLEFVRTPSMRRREAFRAFARAGATVVLGHHPHVSQGVEMVGDSLVAYSLGNFVFHAHSSEYMHPHLPAAATSFVLLVTVAKHRVLGFERVPVVIGAPPDERPRAAVGDEAEVITRQLRSLDALVADDAAVQRLWRENATRHTMRALRAAATSDDPDAFVRTLASVLHVRENREAFDETVAASTEFWNDWRVDVSPFNRPRLLGQRPLPRPSIAARLRLRAQRLRRGARAFGRWGG